MGKCPKNDRQGFSATGTMSVIAIGFIKNMGIVNERQSPVDVVGRVDEGILGAKSILSLSWLIGENN
jgi:hypothetical protein